MSVGSSFDHWQKDVFFSAAEEVQESTDTMESFYRIWSKNWRDGAASEDLEGSLQDLQTALGTAKWQLEEFETAVGLRPVSYSSEDNTTIARRRDFVAAIKSQILRVEKEINYSLCKEGKEPLSWVKLDEDERDDLAAFLSGVNRNCLHSESKAIDYKRPLQVISDCTKGYEGKIKEDQICTEEDAIKESYSRKDKGVCLEEERQNVKSKTLISSDSGSWKIDICDKEDQEKRSPELQCCEPATSGLERVAEPAKYWNYFSNSYGKFRSGEHLQPQLRSSNYLNFNRALQLVKHKLNQMITRRRYRLSSYKEDSSPRARQLVGRVAGFQNHIQGSQHFSQFARPIRLTILLVLTIVFVAPFVINST